MRVLLLILASLLFLAVFAIWAALVLYYVIGNKVKSLQKFYCKIGWHCHKRDYIFNYYDGANDHCTCKWCGYKGMVDSQGNLF